MKTSLPRVDLRPFHRKRSSKVQPLARTQNSEQLCVLHCDKRCAAWGWTEPAAVLQAPPSLRRRFATEWPHHGMNQSSHANAVAGRSGSRSTHHQTRWSPLLKSQTTNTSKDASKKATGVLIGGLGRKERSGGTTAKSKARGRCSFHAGPDKS